MASRLTRHIGKPLKLIGDRMLAERSSKTEDQERKQLALLRQKIAVGVEDISQGRVSRKTIDQIADEVLQEQSGEKP